MEYIWFDYIVQTKEGEIVHIPYTLYEIEESTKLAEMRAEGRILARRLWTGTVDKNNNRIYRGDVLKYDDGCWNDCTEKKCAPHDVRIFEVKWQDARDDIEVCMVGFWLGWSGDEHNPRFIEVIGNIVENPELLETL